MKQLLSVVLLLLFVGVSIQTSVDITKLSNILQKKVKNFDSKFDVIVYLKSSVNFANYESNSNSNARATQIVQDLMRDSKQSSEEVINIARSHNSNLHIEPLWISNAVVIHGCDLPLLHQLSALPSVKRIVSDAPITLKPVFEDEPKLQTGARPNSVEWNVEMIGAKKAWDMGYNGQGIVVGIADTGIDYLHPALVNRYRGVKDAAAKTFDHNYNWYDGIRKHIAPSGGKCGINATNPCDDYGHGTHCTGIILGTSPDGSRQFGAAPNATFVGCRNMDQGTGRPSTYIICLQFFMAPTNLDGTNPKPELRPHIVSNSYGCDPSEQCEPNSLKEATDAITAVGILMAVAAGNSGPGCSTADAGPGIYGSSFTVGATGYQTTKIASFSSRGPVTTDGSRRPKPDISCPGTNIYSTFPNNRYVTMSGTSMATPGVAGCAALLWSAVPSLQRDLAKTIAILEQTALPMPVTNECSSSGVPNNVYGHGIVRADEAIKAAQKQ